MIDTWSWRSRRKVRHHRVFDDELVVIRHPTMMDTLRAFIAINLEVTAIRRVTAAQRALRSSRAIVGEKISWVAAPNMHVTLRFLGNEVDSALIPALADGLRDLLEPLPPMHLSLGPISAFPSVKRARIVMVEIQDPDGRLDELASQVEQLVQSLGIPPERRPFHAHLTLARIRKAADVTRWFADLGPHRLGQAWATECTIYESTLSPTGAEYRALRRFALPKNAAPDARDRSNKRAGKSDSGRSAQTRQPSTSPVDPPARTGPDDESPKDDGRDP